MTHHNLDRDAVLKVGEVAEVRGRSVTVKVDKNKNLSGLIFDGDIINNIAVNSYIELRKGFLRIIGKVDGERIEEEPISQSLDQYNTPDRNRRYLSISLIGYIDTHSRFISGTKELPLIGNEAYIVTKETLLTILNLVSSDELSINIAVTDEGFELPFSIDGLFNGHIAIFGNTGSGKSNTLASLYSALIHKLRQTNNAKFQENTKFLLFDFNGEYVNDSITPEKHIYNLNSYQNSGDKLPINDINFLDLEILSIISDATEKTQKPFLKRTLRLHSRIASDTDLKNKLKSLVEKMFKMSDKIRTELIFGYFEELLPEYDNVGNYVNLRSNIEWHDKDNKGYKFTIGATTHYLQNNGSETYIHQTTLYQHIDNIIYGSDPMTQILQLIYVQLIYDLDGNIARNEHIAPVMRRLKSRQPDLINLFGTDQTKKFWEKNFVVINLNDVRIEMKKIIPLLLSKKLYSDHKKEKNRKAFNLIIDEAHNILSDASFRETENWKDYRLETFEEIIKEGRKFGVFVTISSQRPNDISATITSQAHNYFIHRLINQRDLATIANAVSYIDKLSEDSIPTLPTGTCIFSGIASQRPIKVHIKELNDVVKPVSHTLKFGQILSN